MDDNELGRLVREALAQHVTLAVTVGQLYFRYRASHRWERSWRNKRNLLRPLVLRYWRAPAASFTSDTWADHRAKRRHEPTRLGKPPCEYTLNLELIKAKAMFWFGVRSSMIPANQIADCGYVVTKVHRETWLSWEQVTRLVRGASSLRWPHQRAIMKAWILVAVTTGMRGGEIRRLRWDRISRDGIVYIGSAYTKTKRKRVVAIPAVALGALLCIPRAENTQSVFINEHRNGKLYDLTTIRRWFRQAAEAVGLDGAVADGDVKLLPHDLRHSAASIADSRGAQATAIRDLLGHASLNSTQRYLHRRATESALAIASIMDGPRKGPRRAAQENVQTPLNEVDGDPKTRVTSFS